MSRSNKEARLNHSGMTIADGHGGLKRNMGPAKKVKVNKSKDKPGFVEQLLAGVKGAADTSTASGAESGGESSNAKAIRQTGDAVSSMVETYKTNKAAESSSPGTGGAKA